jgi:hypothetical protein
MYNKEVTQEMRTLHFNTVGYMVSDEEILRWYKQYKEESK